ncbi:MAG TPA: DUF885 domain-containing protein [Pseudomonadales bacterium]|nr:DUF885 domain-containing protein [Pseudomonadales bacterium]
MEVEAYFDSASPFHELSLGHHPEAIPDGDAQALAGHHQAHLAFRDRLNAFANMKLDRQDELSLRTMQLKLGDYIDHFEFGLHLLPMDAEGGFYNRILFHLPRLPFRTHEDFDAYLNWLPSYVDWLESCRQLLELGIAKGIVAPGVIVKNNLGLLAPFLCGMDDHPLMKPFASLGDIEPRHATRIIAAADTLFSERILPAYENLEAFLAGEYLDAAYDTVGVSEMPDGRDWYENRIAFYTTLDLSPEEVFREGEKEVSRIRALMESVIDGAGFDGGFDAFVEHLRRDPSFYPTTPEQLLHHAAWLAKQSEGKLPQLFGRLYRIPFTVEPVPDAIAPNYTAGRYVPADVESRRPGIYWVNVFNLSSRSLYNLPALTLHEAVPGHHLQISLARELTDIPEFRNDYYISAFGEGWGLYAEFLGEEMGMYRTPFEQFGRYSYEMWRACRLVVDVGMHYKGWTREQAIDFLRDNTALSEHEVETEIDRYIGWPGQAVSYKIGELTLKRLRTEAEQALGDRFDLRAFHDTVLQNGSIPLDLLEEEVRRYIADVLSG